MIKFERGQSKEDIETQLIGSLSNTFILPGIPTVIMRTDEIVYNLYTMNNVHKLAATILFALDTETAKEESWHALLNVGPGGLLELTFTDQDEVSVPDILLQPTIGRC